MSLNLSAPAQQGATLRLVYRISAGAIGAAQGWVDEAAMQLTEAWYGAAGAFVVRTASTPAQGGTPGAGSFGILSLVAGRHDFFTAIDVKTDHNLASMTWDQLIGPQKRISLGIAGIDVRCDFDHADLVSAGQATPAAQANAASHAADVSRANDVPATIALDFGKVLVPLLVAAAIALGLAIYLRSRK